MRWAGLRKQKLLSRSLDDYSVQTIRLDLDPTVGPPAYRRKFRIKMKILAIDPGIHTGICTLHYEGPLNHIDRLQTLNNSNLKNTILQAIFFDCPHAIIVERLPGSLGRELNSLVNDVHSILEGLKEIVVEQVGPGEWKPIAKVQGWSSLHGKTSHEKDAYCMARYFIWKHRGEK